MSQESNPGYLELEHIPEKGYNSPENAIRNVIGESEDWCRADDVALLQRQAALRKIYMAEEPVETVDAEAEVVEPMQIMRKAEQELTEELNRYPKKIGMDFNQEAPMTKVVIYNETDEWLVPTLEQTELQNKLLNGTWKQIGTDGQSEGDRPALEA